MAFLLATVLALGALGAPPTFDELYHILAARSWAAEGTPRIDAGIYDRNAFFTAAIGSLFRWFGESPAIARIPSMLAESLLVMAVFSWTRRWTDRATAWWAACLLAVSPLGLFVAGFARPYGIHALLFFLGAAAVVDAFLDGESRWPWLSAAIGLGALGLAAAVQATALIGMAGLAVGLVLVVSLRFQRAHTSSWRWGSWLFGAVVIALIITLLSRSSFGRSVLLEYSESSVWSEGRGARFYHWVLLEKYPTLYTLLPVAAAVAIRRHRDLGLAMAAIFGVGLLAHSFAGMKAERYIHYLMPAFFILWALALRELVPAVFREARKSAQTALAGTMPAARSTPVAIVLGFSVLAFILASNPAFPMAARMAAGQVAYAELGPPFREAASDDWALARAGLRPWLDSVDVVVTTNGLRTLYEIGPYDVELSPTRLSDLDDPMEFTVDPRTGRRLISTSRSLETVVGCYATGLFVSGRRPLARADSSLVAVLRDHATLLRLPEESGLVAYAWSHPARAPGESSCPEVTGARAESPAGITPR